MKINKKIVRYLSLSICVAIIGGIAFTPKTYGNEDIPTAGEFYELQLELEEDFEDEINQEDTQDSELGYDEQDFNYDSHDDYDDNYDDYDYSDYSNYNDNNETESEDSYYPDNSELNNEDYYNENNYDDDSYNNYDFSDFDYSVGNYSNSSYDDYNWGYTEEDFGFLDYDFEDYETEEHIPGSKFLKTPKTIQYTLDLNSKYPKYFDTGIRVQEDGTIGIDGLKEVFKQISIRKNAKFIEDADRVMALIDGKIIVAKGNITKIETLEKIFKDTSVRIKAQDTRAGGKFNLADYLEENGEITVEVNGEKIDLVTSPKLDNSRVLFPIRSIGEAMGAIVEWNDEKAEVIIEKDDKIIKIKGNSDKVFVNDKEYLLSNKTHLDNQERRMLSLINLIVTELDGEVKWNSTESVLVIETPQEEVNLDEGL